MPTLATLVRDRIVLFYFKFILCLAWDNVLAESIIDFDETLMVYLPSHSTKFSIHSFQAISKWC